MYIGVYAYIYIHIYIYVRIQIYVLFPEDTMYQTSKNKTPICQRCLRVDAYSNDIRYMALKETINHQILLDREDTCI